MILQTAILICLGIVHIQAQTNNVYKVQCLPHSATTGTPGKIVLNYNVENAVPATIVIQAVTSRNSKTCTTVASPAPTVACTAGTISGLITPYTCTIDIEASADNSDGCGVSTTGTAPTQSSTFDMTLTYVDGLTQTIDAVITNTCDWSVDPTTGNVKPGVASVSGSAPSVTATIGGGVSSVVAKIFYIPKAASTAPTELTGAAAVGDKLQLRLTVPEQYLQYLKASVMEADHKADFSSADKKTLLSAGCGKTPWMKKTSYFKYDATLSTAPARTYVIGGSAATSITFSAFFFNNAATANQVYFQVTVKLSATDNDMVDSDCTARRKRDAPNGNDTEVSVVARIFVYPYTGHAKQKLSTQQDLSCFNNVSFLAVIAVLAVVLIITVGVVIFFAVKATRSQTTDKESYPNPAYKA